MDFAKIAHILQGLESGAVTPEQGAILIDGIVEILNKLRPQLKKWWFRVMLDGVKVSLMELKEHLEEIDDWDEKPGFSQ